jgi:hypothetical protein
MSPNRRTDWPELRLQQRAAIAGDEQGTGRPMTSAGVCEVVRCHVWLGRTKGAMIDGGSTVRRPCSALLPG